MAGERLALLADGHLTRRDGARLDTLVARLDGLKGVASTLFILGDLFEVWLGVGTKEPHVSRVGDALCRLRSAGVRTGYVEGNRDFAIGRGATAGMFDVVARREHLERFGSCTYHFSHGDLVNGNDRQYRLWRGFAKGVLAPVGLRLLPDRTAIALAARLETDLRSTNRRHKSRFPEEACLAHARARVAEGADVVVVGHFHREVVREVEAAGRRGRFLSLPFWHDEPVILLFDRDGSLSRA